MNRLFHVTARVTMPTKDALFGGDTPKHLDGAIVVFGDDRKVVYQFTRSIRRAHSQFEAMSMAFTYFSHALTALGVDDRVFDVDVSVWMEPQQ